MNSSGSWSSELLNEGQVLLEPSPELDPTLGVWAVVPLSMIALFLIVVCNYDPCREDDNDTADTRP